MKAWFVWVGDEWGDYVHGETAAKAKAIFWEKWAWEADEWIYLRAVRCPEFDDIPITQEVITSHNGEETTWWYPICDCEICDA